ncbi:Interferon-induced GTP-binding protein Mx2 [Lachnellula arida]|uniref:Interferon-induced GTP-binding protein Mx2 n=1 Tax=Lachnellula arida TaxID=1316785 RepID=A0A8T9BDW3_9HELO|nr:Interferon-induced GTP-binding protein Mx2 [Lachnellula arida]
MSLPRTSLTDSIKLIVVGDQLSGKSSVLEGLTNLPFPRDSGLCTRFPTQIVFKRSKVSTIEVSIIAAHGQSKSTVNAIAKFDPNGQRTLGVLTKPDLVDRGAEEKILELVTNQTGRGRFQLGYTIICNRSQSELGLTHHERNLREARFFETQPWSVVPKKRAGAVAVDVRSKIRELEVELDDLGPAREISNDQRNHLIRIASDFRGITVKAIDAYYGRDQCFEDDDDFRLATNVMDMDQNFSETIRRQGFTRSFRRNSDTAATEHESEPENISSQCGSEDSSSSFSIITKKYDRSKGFEIGTLNPSLLPSLFAEQSQWWEYYANCHVKKVIQKIHQFNHKALCYCCKDSILSERLWTRLAQLLLPSYREALNQVSFLVSVEKDGNLMTMNHYFADNLRKAREDRITRQLLNLQSWSTSDAQKEPLLRLKDTIAAFLSNEEYTVRDLHDTLEAYYKVARKRFVDAVCL